MKNVMYLNIQSSSTCQFHQLHVSILFSDNAYLNDLRIDSSYLGVEFAYEASMQK